MFVAFGKRVKFNPQQALQCRAKPAQCYCSRCISQSYYDILKVPQTCSSKDVRDAFINLSKKNHPDKHLNDPTMHERFVQINEAYTVLINPTSRRAYDMTLSHKKKLEASYARPAYPYYQYNSSYHQYNQHQQNKKSQGQNTNSQQRSHTYSQNTDNNYYSYYETDKRTKDYSFENTGYYGIKGIKRVSNALIVTLLVAVSLFSFSIQMFVVRNHAIKSKEQSMEKSRRYTLMHAMSKEKARLYGNKHQIEVLKKSLLSSFEVLPIKEATLQAEVVPDQVNPVVPDQVSPVVPDQVNPVEEPVNDIKDVQDETVTFQTPPQPNPIMAHTITGDGDIQIAPSPQIEPPIVETNCKKCKKKKVKSHVDLHQPSEVPTNHQQPSV